ncbi:MAG: hypothetical protein IKK22_01540 [Firmicutes bacterium]|nr:hypothetical protein [Bacillota bacterium]MBR7148131.1 hypothetical protein [Bacillota bacterium]
MDERMKGEYDYQNLIRKGQIHTLVDMIRKDPEIIGFSHEFSRDDVLIAGLWKEQPAMARRIMTELMEGMQGTEVIRLLESLSCPFSFGWDGCKCDVYGNFLFWLVWNGEHELVKTALDHGMDPDGACRGIYITESGKHIAPISRWGKMKCRVEEDGFFAFDHWHDPWGVMERAKNAYIITPLYLAQLQDDQRMIHMLKEAGAHPVPSREKMWEDAKAPKSTGSIFGNI